MSMILLAIPSIVMQTAITTMEGMRQEEEDAPNQPKTKQKNQKNESERLHSILIKPEHFHSNNHFFPIFDLHNI